MWSRWVPVVAITAAACGGPTYQAAKNGAAGTGGATAVGGAGGSTPERDAAADAPAGDTRPPNVLILLTDDQRADTVHALGNSLIHTARKSACAVRGSSARE